MNKEQTHPKLERVELKSSVEVIINDQILDKIRHLCRKVPKLEWSGLMFYTMTGSIKKPSECKITIEDIFLMDIGSKVATGFDWENDIVEYRMNNLESLDWIVGHIHSHNDMDVWFSSTDWSELNDNCSGFNFYLSLIVNNYLDMKAKIAFTAEATTYNCKDEEGKDYQMNIAGRDPAMFVYECIVKLPEIPNLVSEEFNQRFQDVAAKVAQRNLEEQKRAEQDRRRPSGPLTQSELAWPEYPSIPPSYKTKSGEQGSGHHDDFRRANQEILNRINGDEDITDERLKELEEFEDAVDMGDFPNADFTAYLLRLGLEVPEDDPVEALSDLEIANINPNEIVRVIKDNYPSYYDAFFKEETPKPDSEKVLENVLTMLEIYSAEYEICQQLHAELSDPNFQANFITPAPKKIGGKKKAGKV